MTHSLHITQNGSDTQKPRLLATTKTFIDDAGLQSATLKVTRQKRHRTTVSALRLLGELLGHARIPAGPEKHFPCSPITAWLHSSPALGPVITRQLNLKLTLKRTNH